MSIYNIADIMTCFVESIMMFMLYDTFCQKKDDLSLRTYVVGVITLMLMINISNTLFSFGIFNVLGMIGSFFVMSFLYEGKMYVKIIFSIVNYLLIIIVEVLVLFAISLAFNIKVTNVVNSAQYRLLGIIVSKMISLLIVNAVRLRFRNKPFHMGATYWALFLVMFITSTITVFLIFKLSYDIDGTHMYNLSIICSFGLLMSTFFALYLYEHLANQGEVIRNQQQYEQHLKDQLKHLDEIIAAQNQLRKFKHDFNNYKIGLKSYLDDNDCGGALKYLKKLSGDFDSFGGVINTGNTALDAILNAKKAIADSNGIPFTMHIQIPRNLDVDPIDLCVIFGNAIDNAIESCEKIKYGDKRIDLTLLCRDKRLFCKIVNTAAETRKTIFDTSKPDSINHGFGLDSIKATIEKYNGVPVITQENKEFLLKFVLFTK